MTVRLDQVTCGTRMSSARVAHLGTVGQDAWPHLVPVTFAVVESRIVIAIDQKPKRTTDLRRLRNIAENPKVAVLADRYDDDWSQLWWVRADGRAVVVADGQVRADAIDSLTAKYEQYREDPPLGPVIVITVESWSGWSYSA